MADEGLTAGAVARRLGVAVTTLRTWHQRYGLGPSQHEPGHHRRYTSTDLYRLDVMRRLTAQGVSPAQAAAWARRAEVPSQQTGAGSYLAADATGDTPSRDGGGNAIPTGRAGPLARGLARAAIRLDAPAMREILAKAVSDQGVVATWEQVVLPVLTGIGERYEATRRLVEVEHLASRSITEVLGAVPRPSGPETPRVLLACADEEQHSLPLEALAAALAEAGVQSRLLGARVPPQALDDAVARTGPVVVVVWSHTPPTADPAQLMPLLRGSHRPFVVAAAGPGWANRELPAEVVVLRSLAEAMRVVMVAVDATRSG